MTPEEIKQQMKLLENNLNEWSEKIENNVLVKIDEIKDTARLIAKHADKQGTPFFEYQVIKLKQLKADFNQSAIENMTIFFQE